MFNRQPNYCLREKQVNRREQREQRRAGSRAAEEEKVDFLTLLLINRHINIFIRIPCNSPIPSYRSPLFELFPYKEMILKVSHEKL